MGVPDTESRQPSRPLSPITAAEVGRLPAPYGADVVYFLMSPGWERELRSNRWHYARRWAQLLPVVLVQPTEQRATRPLAVGKERRIGNCDVLQVQAGNDGRSYLEDALVQVGQVTTDMRLRGRRRALLWCYNPMLAGLYAAFPAVGRVFHATENYFDFDNVSRLFLDCLRIAIQISDLTVAVSNGVAAGCRKNVPPARIEVVTNGCDYREYSRYRPDPRLAIIARDWKRVAIYAGNINARLDFILLERCVALNPKTLYVFVGPVRGLDAADAGMWERLLAKPNVRHFEERDPEDLPGLYGAADVGIVPYKQTRMLVENGFPLKVLEMCATGLPVVATLMKPIVDLTQGLAVARDHDEFLKELSTTSRERLTEVEKQEMKRICEHHDYDRKFETVLSILGETGSTAAPETTRFDAIVDFTGRQWNKLAVREWRQRSTQTSKPLVVRLLPVRVLKSLVAGRIILGDPVLRRLLISGAVLRLRGTTIALGRLLLDLFRLGILRRTAACSVPLGGQFEVQLHYDGQSMRLVAETIGPDDMRPRSEPDVSAVLSDDSPVREIVWDHSAMGTVAPILIAGWAVWVFVGADGQYRFQALAALAEGRMDRIREAFRPLAARGL
jgi:glycosyltransferase involved in cell wall biosynthesis